MGFSLIHDNVPASQSPNFNSSYVLGYTSAQINSLMDTIIAKNVFFTTSGALVKKSGANFTQKTVTKIDVA